jgi:hypothetical protein
VTARPYARSQGKRVAFDDPNRKVIEDLSPILASRSPSGSGKFKTMDEAVAWVKRCPNSMLGSSEIEIRPLQKLADFQ